MALGPSAAVSECALPDPLDAACPPPPDRYCDLVLKGGVVDGVVYPWAILELARRYHFRSLGGTSVGAMAAALAAAAEYGRRYGSDAGFNEVLRKLPRELASPQASGRTRLFTLFQPHPAGQRLFELFVASFRSGGNRLVAAVVAGLNIYGAAFVLAWGLCSLGYVVCGGDAGLHESWGVALGADASPRSQLGLYLLVALLLPVCHLPTWLLLGLCCLLFVLWREVVKGLLPHGFGLCPGSQPAGAPASHHSPLVDWLHQGIQGAAGRPLDRPLTFKDLWDAPGGPGAAPRSIDLRMVTTSLTHGRPFGLPLGPADERLFYRPEELADYFPASVLQALVRHSKAYAPRDAGDPPAGPETQGLLELPQGDLPIVVAARMSLSFPVLFCTVPLWAIDFRSGETPRRLQPCRFTDGGLCSNFPIHLFDAALPGWPTFGISLEKTTSRSHRQQVWVTRFHTQGRADAWAQVGGAGQSSLAQIASFAGSILNATMGWNDGVSMRLPGVRDRIAHIALGDGANGHALDLRIEGLEILRMARDLGQQAGLALVEKFAPTPAAGPSAAWREHRWVRFNSFVAALRERIKGFEASADGNAHNPALDQQIQQALQQPPLDGGRYPEPPLTDSQAQALQDAVRALVALERSFAQHPVTPAYRDQPQAELHLKAPL